MKLAIDFSSLCWPSLLVGKDHEFGQVVDWDGRPFQVNSAAYGYENLMNSICSAMKSNNVTPIDVILVVEGKSSKSKRLAISPTYKAGKGRPAECYVEFNLLKERVIKVWRDVGATILIQDFAEADDTLFWLARETEEDLIIVSRDGDLTASNTEGVNAYGAKVQVWNEGRLGVNKYGFFPYDLVPTYKALVGDAGDKIPGAKGFGPAKWEKCLEQFGEDGMYELRDLLEAGDLDPLHAQTDDKLVKLIVESEAAVLLSYKLAKPRPEWVNTRHSPLQWQAGMVQGRTAQTDERLVEWAGVSRLVTAGNYAKAVEWLRSELRVSPFAAFDIETSTPEESDEWLAAQGDPDGVDMFGSVLTGFSITFGRNTQNTIYVSVDHAETDNITMVQARELIEVLLDSKLETVIQNTMFELSVLYQAQDEDGSLWRDHWKKYGEQGMLPNVLDTKLEASYVDENIKSGLKSQSKLRLGYEQTSYATTTTLSGLPGSLPPGGKDRGVLKVGITPDRYWHLGEEISKDEVDALGESAEIEWEEATFVEHEQRQYKMNELTARQVFAYGCDDTICTAALHVFNKLFMQLEHSYKVYLQVEIAAAYQHAKSFVDGVPVSLETLRVLAEEDSVTYNEAWASVRGYLISKGWEGTQPPVYTVEITPAEIKEAFHIVTGNILKTAVRTNAKLVEMIAGGINVYKAVGLDGEGEPVLEEAPGNVVFAAALRGCLKGKAEEFTAYVLQHFKGEPAFNSGSPKQMCHLMYAVMGLECRVFNKPTDKMRAAGQKQGNPQANSLAIAYAMQEADETCKEVLQGLQLMKMVATRRGLYYEPYPKLLHWKDGLMHANHNQCATNTRRASMSRANLQQLGKNVKIEGQAPRVRECLVPHHRKAVVVSMDFSAQELRIIADYSQDANMLSCYVGDSKQDMHALTGLGILRRQVPACQEMGYDEYVLALKQPENEFHKQAKASRALGKTTNFSAAYGSGAAKLASQLMVSEEDGQIFLDAKLSAFPDEAAWKEGVIEEAKRYGVVRTRMGAVRHLAALLDSSDRFEASKAERQAVNFCVQSSAAEMTKLAEGRMWSEQLRERFDCRFYAAVHDEVLVSVAVSDLHEFLPEMHACMVAPYADMRVPVESSISLGLSFGVQTELGTVYDREVTNDALLSLKETT